MAAKKEYRRLPWHYVKFPTGATFLYVDLKHATVGRIWAQAWTVFIQQNPDLKVDFSTFAHGTGILKTVRVDGRGKRKRSFSNGYAEVLFQHVRRGTLPKDPKKRAVVEKLAAAYEFPDEPTGGEHALDGKER